MDIGSRYQSDQHDAPVQRRNARHDESPLGPDHQCVFNRWRNWQSRQANYAASKAGVVAMSKSLAYEVATRGITVNCIAPGFITTAMTDKLTEDQKTGILTQVPAGRMGTSGEIAAAALYLASDEAGYTTGATLHVNGGMAML